MSEIDKQFASKFNDAQSLIMTFRRIQLSIGATIMFFIIVSIIRSTQIIR